MVQEPILNRRGWRQSLPIFTLAILLSSCGGGGNGGEGGGAGNPVQVAPAEQFPTLVTSPQFQLPGLASPSETVPMLGTYSGQLRLKASSNGPAGTLVELLDLSSNEPSVLGTAQTDGAGRFAVKAAAGAVAPLNLLLRATLADGSKWRAFASGYTDISPATEFAVKEITRLSKTGAFTAHALQTTELMNAQSSLGLAWVASFGQQEPSAALTAMLNHYRFNATWNDFLDRLAKPEPTTSAGDIAALMPYTGGIATATLSNGVNLQDQKTVRLTTDCRDDTDTPGQRICNFSLTDDPNSRTLWDSVAANIAGLSLGTRYTSATGLNAVLEQVGKLPLLEFPYVVGTRVVYENAKLVLTRTPAIHASVKITRKTFPVDGVAALQSPSIPAVQVAMDYEIAVLDTGTGKQSDYLLRESRWFSPQAAQVRRDALLLSRINDQVSIEQSQILVQQAPVSTFAPPVIPFASVPAIKSLALKHRHAVYSAALNRIFVASNAQGGQILELDPNTLTTTRTIQTMAVPGRLAVSADGTRLYAGLDGARLLEWRTSDMQLQHQTQLPNDPYGNSYERVIDLSIDPFDASRVIVVATRSTSILLIYQNGDLLLRDAPRYHADGYGWGYYEPNNAAWTSTPNEFLVSNNLRPSDQYRFRVTPSGTLELSALRRVDDVGVNETNGLILTGQGQYLDAISFANRGRIVFSDYGLAQCALQTTQTSLCQLQSNYAIMPPVFVLQTRGSGEFLGTFSPKVKTVKDGCSGTDLDIAFAMSSVYLTPMGDGRSLVSLAQSTGDIKCTLQVWTLQGTF